MKQKSWSNSIKKRGMTLAEVVIAIAVIASTVPLIMGAMSSAHRSRQSAETDTRSAWLVRDVQQRIQNEWAEAADIRLPQGCSMASQQVLTASVTCLP